MVDGSAYAACRLSASGLADSTPVLSCGFQPYDAVLDKHPAVPAAERHPDRGLADAGGHGQRDASAGRSVATTRTGALPSSPPSVANKRLPAASSV